MAYNPNIHHRRSIRLKNYDYSKAGAYFITICCKDMKCIFGEIIEGEMKLNEMGIIAHNEWLKTAEIRKNVELDEFIIMPNHMHAIIISTGELHSPNNSELHSPNNDSELHSPNKIEFHSPNNCESHSHIDHNNNIDLHSQIDNTNRGQLHSPLRGPSNNIGAIVRGYKSAVTKQLKLLNFGRDVWQRNYYDHIIRDKISYQNISNYIINNPSKWNNDKFHKK